jgi:putative transposase
MSKDKLPHISLKDHYQFITFRTYKSIDKYVSKIQNNHNIDTKIKQFQIDTYLDNSKNGAYFYGKAIDIIKEVLFEKNNILYEVETFSIMPNHIHILLKQKSELPKIIQHIKGKSAFLLNKHLNLEGKFWHDNYFDKLIRDEKHYGVVYEYIINNPLKANLGDSKKRIYEKYL